jgi:hypothetical protein
MQPPGKNKFTESTGPDHGAPIDSSAGPAWHEAELKQTETDYLAGRIEVLDWEIAKRELRRSFKQGPGT